MSHQLKLLLKVCFFYFVLTGARSVCTVSHACQLGGSKHPLGNSWEQILSLFANGVAMWLLHILIVARSERLDQTTTVCCTFHRVWEVLQAPLPTAGRSSRRLFLPAFMTLVSATLGSCHHYLGCEGLELWLSQESYLCAAQGHLGSPHALLGKAGALWSQQTHSWHRVLVAVWPWAEAQICFMAQTGCSLLSRFCKQSSKLRNTMSWWRLAARDMHPLGRKLESTGRITQQVWGHTKKANSKYEKQMFISHSYLGS